MVSSHHSSLAVFLDEQTTVGQTGQSADGGVPEEAARKNTHRQAGRDRWQASVPGEGTARAVAKQHEPKHGRNRWTEGTGTDPVRGLGAQGACYRFLGKQTKQNRLHMHTHTEWACITYFTTL